MNGKTHGGARIEDKRTLARRLDGAGWGLFFAWIGIALLAHTGWSVWLLGMGIIMLGGQLVRRYFDIHMDRFALIVGVLFVLGGVWEMLEVRLGSPVVPGGLMPILSIVAGVILFFSALFRKPPERAAG